MSGLPDQSQGGHNPVAGRQCSIGVAGRGGDGEAKSPDPTMERAIGSRAAIRVSEAIRFLDLFGSSDYSRVTFVGSPRRAGPFVSLASGLGAPAPGRPCGSNSGPATSCGSHDVEVMMAHRIVGKPIGRLDGIEKVSGEA